MTTYDPIGTDLRDFPFAGGFVLTKKKLSNVLHMEEFKAPHGWRIWSDSAVRHDYAENARGFVWINGHWADTSDEFNATQQPVASSLLGLASESYDVLHKRLQFLGGRFVLLVCMDGEMRVYHDPIGARSVYYSTHGIVCSHLNLLTYLTEDNQKRGTYREFQTALDETHFANVRQLLPNFYLTVGKQVTRYYPQAENLWFNQTTVDKLDRIHELWSRLLQQYTARHSNITLSLSGGIDSRLMLAMSKDFVTDLHSFTYGSTDIKKYGRTTNTDMGIVKQLLEVTGLQKHAFIERTEIPTIDPGLRQLLRINTNARHGFDLVGAYRKLYPGDGWLHIRGNGVEIASGRQASFRPKGSASFQRLCSSLATQKIQESLPKLTARAAELGYDQVEPGYSRWDLAYWELRLGRWHSEIMNEHFAAFDTVTPVTVREIIDILFSFPSAHRDQSRPVYELINASFPVLNFFGVNRSTNLYEATRKKSTNHNNRLNTDFSDRAVRFRNGDEITLPDPTERKVLWMPIEHFQEGNRVSGTIFTAPKDGSLQLTIHQPYKNKAGRNHFAWYICVDGRDLLECDGALSSLPTHVTLNGLRSGQRVSVALVALRTHKATSWQRATKLSVSDLSFYPQEGRHQLRLHHDSAVAKSLQN
ncbi:hypothetical protein QP572_08110 [Brevibacterium sp. UMB10442]|nr:hypothetical protein [Brevibacterium sp. UMB10442]